MNTCNFIKTNGEKCKTRPLKDDGYCFFHSDKTKEKRKEAVTKGGHSLKRNYGREDIISLKNVDDVLVLLEQTANDLRQNKTNTKTAVILNFIANTSLKAIEAGYMMKKRKDLDRKSFDQIEMEKLMYPKDNDS